LCHISCLTFVTLARPGSVTRQTVGCTLVTSRVDRVKAVARVTESAAADWRIPPTESTEAIANCTRLTIGIIQIVMALAGITHVHIRFTLSTICQRTSYAGCRRGVVKTEATVAEVTFVGTGAITRSTVSSTRLTVAVRSYGKCG